MTEKQDNNAGSASRKGPSLAIRRTTARLVAVQALYGYEMMRDASSIHKEKTEYLEKIAATYVENDLQKILDESELAAPDGAWSRRLVVGACEAVDKIDGHIVPLLALGEDVKRLDRVMHAILRVATYELLQMPEVPVKVVINEYVGVARSFFDEGQEVGFINGMLDRLSRELRSEEMQQIKR